MKTDVFVPNGDSRAETAILLVGTAREYDIPQESIRASSTGFWITDELADLLYEDEPEAEPETKAETKKSKKD